jgi:hypothetical protein
MGYVEATVRLGGYDRLIGDVRRLPLHEFCRIREIFISRDGAEVLMDDLSLHWSPPLSSVRAGPHLTRSFACVGVSRRSTETSGALRTAGSN